MLELSGVEAGYGSVRVLKGVSLRVGPGEAVALIGANGAGKTTTLRVVHGLLEPSAGQVRFRGSTLAGVPTEARVALGMGHVPEGRQVFSRLTVRENLRLGAYTRRDAAGVREDLERVLEVFPRLRERLRQKGGTLSGGEQQMLAMGRALMGRPSLLLLDEPSMGLAPLVVEQIFRVIAEIHRAGTAVLLVEQNAYLALELCSRAYVLTTGSVVAEGAARDLLVREEIRAAYLGG
ncbi:MAG: ABC transporter ATP-binding protein [Planctomycetes bacterium]|nr:ABC transporter ATP-binding protein [Planctomycetota bacterium]